MTQRPEATTDLSRKEEISNANVDGSFRIPVVRSPAFRVVPANRFFLNERFDGTGKRVLLSFHRRDPLIKSMSISKNGDQDRLTTAQGTAEVGLPDIEWYQSEEVAVEMSAEMALELANLIKECITLAEKSL